MNYRQYKFSKKELIVQAIIWLCVCGVFAFFFYRSIIAFVVIGVFIPLFLKARKVTFAQNRRWKLALDFREYISMVAMNLSSGNSVENSFIKAYTDIGQLYGSEADITKEAKAIVRGLENNLVLEDLLIDLGNRSNVEEIRDFADIFSAAKRTGGNLREIIEDTSRQISDKIEMKREIKVVIAEKEMEHKIMCLIPFFIMTYIGLTNKGYFDVLYHNPVGIGVMSGCALCYVVAFVWGQKITKIN